MVAVVNSWAKRRAAPKPDRLAICLRLKAASIAVPSGASAGHSAPSGRAVPAEELRRRTQRGLQDRSMYSSDEGLHHV
jgi:hypothetical protein